MSHRPSAAPLRRASAVAAGTILLLTSVSLSLPAQASPAAVDQSLASRVDSLFARFDQARGPGCAVGVYRDGRAVVAKGFGLADLESGVRIDTAVAFNLASVSKQFTAYAVGLLIERGRVSPEDDVRRFIPEFPEYGSPVRVKHLIHHTSGIRDVRSLATRAGWQGSDLLTHQAALDLVTRQRALNFAPGTNYLYSNSNYALLAEIVSRVSGKSLAAFAAEEMFAPLGMTRTRFAGPSEVVPNRARGYAAAGKDYRADDAIGVMGASALLTSIGDLARWEENFIVHRIGSARLDSLMSTPGRLDSGAPLTYAYGFGVSEPRPGIRQFDHTGLTGGFSTAYYRFPDRHEAVAVLCNGGSNAQALATGLTVRLLPASRATTVGAAMNGGTTNAVEPTAATERAPSELAGEYVDRWSGAARAIVLDSLGQPAVSMGPGSALRSTPLSNGRYRLAEFPRYEYTFRRDARGPWSLDERIGDLPPTTFEKVPTQPATPRPLSIFAGTYWSDDLGVAYSVVARGSQLMLRAPHYDDEVITRAFEGVYRSQMGLLSFEIDRGEHASGFMLSTDRARGLTFRRISELERVRRGPTTQRAKPLGTWEAAPSLRNARAAHAVVSTGEAIYALGGTGAGRRPVLEIERFDGTRWSAVGTLPGEGLNAPAAAVLGERLFVIGGFTTTTNVPSERVSVYDLRQRTWSDAAKLPAPRGGHAAAVLRGRIHVLGGGNSQSTIASHSVYDPTSDAWVDRAPLPRAEGSPAAVVFGGKLYAIGGRSGSADYGDVYVYDDATDRWSTAPSIPPRGTAGAVVYCGMIHLFGGESQARASALNDVLTLGAGDVAWTFRDPMPTPRTFARAVLFRDAVYVVGGSPLPGSSHESEGSTIVERFTARCR